jgi:hypothetical protein
MGTKPNRVAAPVGGMIAGVAPWMPTYLLFASCEARGVVAGSSL